MLLTHSNHILFYLILSYLILSYPILSYILSYLILSYLICSSDTKDVTVLAADTFQPVNWVGISEVIFHQVEHNLSIFEHMIIFQHSSALCSIFEHIYIFEHFGLKICKPKRLLQMSSQSESEEYRQVIKRIALGVHLNNRSSIEVVNGKYNNVKTPLGPTPPTSWDFNCP